MPEQPQPNPEDVEQKSPTATEQLVQATDHPNRVDDEDKARAMAAAGDSDRSMAAFVRVEDKKASEIEALAVDRENEAFREHKATVPEGGWPTSGEFGKQWEKIENRVRAELAAEVHAEVKKMFSIYQEARREHGDTEDLRNSITGEPLSPDERADRWVDQLRHRSSSEERPEAAATAEYYDDIAERREWWAGIIHDHPESGLDVDEAIRLEDWVEEHKNIPEERQWRVERLRLEDEEGRFSVDQAVSFFSECFGRQRDAEIEALTRNNETTVGQIKEFVFGAVEKDADAWQAQIDKVRSRIAVAKGEQPTPEAQND